MENISPDTQVVLTDLTQSEYGLDPADIPNEAARMAHIAAITLRSLVKIDNIKAEPVGPCDESFGDYLLVASISQRDYRYDLALHKSKVQVATERKLLTIATELENI
jgi:hypothetical protein